MRHDWIRMDEIEEMLEGLWARRLGRNIAIGAGLCMAHELGYRHGYHSCPCGDVLDDEQRAEIDSRYFYPGSHRACGEGWG